MIKFFHRLFHPHCEHCLLEQQCDTCDVLKSQLERANYEKDKLLAQLERMVNPPVPIEEPQELPQPLKPRTVPWEVTRNILEQADRKKAEQIRADKLEELEKETGISDGEGDAIGEEVKEG